MKINLRQTKLRLLRGLLALSGLTANAYLASERWSGHSAAPAVQVTAIFRTRGGEPLTQPGRVRAGNRCWWTGLYAPPTDIGGTAIIRRP